MIFKKFTIDLPNHQTNAYILGCAKTRKALLVDCPAFTDEMRSFLHENDLQLRKVFVTHDHRSHVDALTVAIDEYGAAVYSGNGKADNYRTRQVGHADELCVGEITGRVVETPGHTSDGISLIIFPKEGEEDSTGMVFTGDALLAGHVGDAPTPEERQREIKRLRDHVMTLPAEFQVHPGHGESTTVGAEKAANPSFATV
jgi:glyoxylase-like metal-dependent hydrolase (beta-lactamase superfamily II)